MTEPTLPERPPVSWRLTLAALARLPQGALSRLAGRLADTPIPPALRPSVLGGFARAFGIDVSEAERPLEEYGSLNAFFVRRLRAGLRTWPSASGAAGSPVDGIVGEHGVLRQGTLVQAKARGYAAADLLGDAAEAERFESGPFLTLYLSPRHYHRIHAPVGGRVARARYLPGGLLPVNAPAVSHVDRLFARNERLVCYLDGSPLGRVAVVAVGAYNVGRISAAFDDAWGAGPAGTGWVTNRRGAAAETRDYAPPVTLERGAELMAFHLGSTVVLLFEPGVALDRAVRRDAELRLGQVVAAQGTAG